VAGDLKWLRSLGVVLQSVAVGVGGIDGNTNGIYVYSISSVEYVAVYHIVLQYVAVYHIVLQCVAVGGIDGNKCGVHISLYIYTDPCIYKYSACVFVCVGVCVCG